MLGSADAEVSAPVDGLARAVGADAWRLAVVAGASERVATRSALHAVVTGTVRGGEASERPAVLGLARSWALTTADPEPPAAPGPGPVSAAFWSLPEPQRSALWCTDALGLPAEDVQRVVTGAGRGAAAVARGCLRRQVCREHREAAAGTGCAPAAEVLSRVLAGHAPKTKAALVRRHAGGCERCAAVLASLEDIGAALVAAVAQPPELAAEARKAWRNHVGAPRRSLADLGRGAAPLVSSNRRPLVGALAVAIAGSFGAATTQLAVSTEEPPPSWLAAPTPLAPPTPATAAPVRPAVRRQAIIPPLAEDALADPGLAALVTPDLGEVTPVLVAPPPAPAPVAAPTPAPAAAPAALAEGGEPPPAVDQATVVDLTLPLPVPLDVGVEVGPRCTTIRVGFLRLVLPCAS